MTCMFADSFFSRSSGTFLGIPIISILGSILGSPYFGKLPLLYERKLDIGLGLEPNVEKAGSLGRDMPAANLKAPILLLVLFRILLLVLLLLLK